MRQRKDEFLWSKKITEDETKKMISSLPSKVRISNKNIPIHWQTSSTGRVDGFVEIHAESKGEEWIVYVVYNLNMKDSSLTQSITVTPSKKSSLFSNIKSISLIKGKSQVKDIDGFSSSVEKAVSESLRNVLSTITKDGSTVTEAKLIKLESVLHLKKESDDFEGSKYSELLYKASTDIENICRTLEYELRTTELELSPEQKESVLDVWETVECDFPSYWYGRILRVLQHKNIGV